MSTHVSPPPPPLRSPSRTSRSVYTVRGIDRAVLRGVSFSIAPGEAYGLVGESGCGKSTTCLRRTALPPAERQDRRRPRAGGR